MSTLTTTTRPTARELHRCGTCRRDILPGEIYSRVTSLDDGEVYSWVYCAQCDECWTRYYLDHDIYDEADAEASDDELWEWLHEWHPCTAHRMTEQWRDRDGQLMWPHWHDDAEEATP